MEDTEQLDVTGEDLGLRTVAEVATLLRLSEKTVRRRIWSGELEAIRVGSAIRVTPEAIAAWRASRERVVAPTGGTAA